MAALNVLSLSAVDFAEGNATNWGSFVPSWEGATSSVSNATNLLRVGTYSLRFDTSSGFDTGVVYPKGPTAHWDLSTNTHLVFWSRGENTNSFQDNRPVLVLNSPGGSFRYEPEQNLTLNHQWVFIKVPLAGDEHWTRTTNGSPTLANVTQLEIHEDTWANGFTMYYDGVEFVSLNPAGPPPGPPGPAGVDLNAIRQRVLLYILDPVMEDNGNRRLHQVYGWMEPQELTARIISDFRTNSHGLYLPQIIETRLADEYPWMVDGFRYDDASYDAALRSGSWHNSSFDYWRFLTEKGISDRIQSGDIDEVWVYAAPGIGATWESTMVGQDAYWCNSSPVPGATNSRVAVVMGWNYERGVAEALESFGHRSESIMWKIYDYDWDSQGGNAWSTFTLLDKNAPGLGAVGNVHYPVNGQSDYDWGNTNFVLSTCDAWINYPNLTNAPRLVNFREWAGDDPDVSRRYLNWWYGHFPHAPGKAPAPDHRLNNWWRYLIDLEQFKGGNGTLATASGLGTARITQPVEGVSLSGIIPVTVEAGVDGALGRVDLYVDGTYYASDTLAPFRFAWNPGGLIGTHTLVAKAYELQSGAEIPSAPVTVCLQSGTLGGFVHTNSVGLANVSIAATVRSRQWLRSTSSPAAIIPDTPATSLTNTITIAAGGTLLDANIGLTIRHPRPSDLEVQLVHPGGASVVLHAAGGSSDPDLITFFPELTSPAQSLTPLAGLPIQGDWRLVVHDLVGGSAGQLVSWSLSLNYRQTETFTVTTDATGHYSLTNLPAGDYELRPTRTGDTFLPIVTNLAVNADAHTVDFVSGPNFPATFTTPPSNQMAYAGSSVQFSVEVCGTGPFHYQWLFNGAPIANSDAAVLGLTNVLLDQAGRYTVVVSNPMPTSATASALLTVLATPLLADLCEGNATNWGAFWPAWEATHATTSDSTNCVKVGLQSIRFDTGSGFDTGVRFPRNADAHWDLRNVGWLSFWCYPENTNSFQGPQPMVVLNCRNGTITLQPNTEQIWNRTWSFLRVPLGGNAVWQRATEGTPNLADVNQIEFHQDTWANGFSIWYDAVQFEPLPWFEPPMPANDRLYLTLHAPDGLPCVLQTSTNLTLWTPVATNSPAGGRIEWLLPHGPSQQFFRGLAAQ